MTVKKLVREFTYNGVKLADPDPSMSLEDVRNFYAIMHKDILTAVVEGPEERAGKLVYTFHKAVGTKQ